MISEIKNLPYKEFLAIFEPHRDGEGLIESFDPDENPKKTLGLIKESRIWTCVEKGCELLIVSGIWYRNKRYYLVTKYGFEGDKGGIVVPFKNLNINR